MVTAWLVYSACARSSDDLPPAYREIPVPEQRLVSADARARGRHLFLEHCALCHGDNADGRGSRREGLSLPPRDFTDPTWRRSTSARRVYFAIREGVHGSPMPAWKGLDENAAWDLVSYVLSVAAP
jgi:mono/diheme cytochrome c family protein